MSYPDLLCIVFVVRNCFGCDDYVTYLEIEWNVLIAQNWNVFMYRWGYSYDRYTRRRAHKFRYYNWTSPVAWRFCKVNTCGRWKKKKKHHKHTHTHNLLYALDCQPSLRQSPWLSTGLSNCGQGMHPSVENMETVLLHCTGQPLSTDGTTEQECDLWFGFSHRKKHDDETREIILPASPNWPNENMAVCMEKGCLTQFKNVGKCPA